MLETDSLHGRRAPVILLGRGGSGTRLLSELARNLGVFLGNDINVSGDSVEWVNDLYDLGVEETERPIEPWSARDLDWTARLHRLADAVLAAGGWQPPTVWGWKLPETMVGLAPALRAFPSAKVIHFVRHPVGSALRRTHMTSRMDNRIGGAVLPAAYRDHWLDVDDIALDPPWMHNAMTWDFQVRYVLRVLSVDPKPVLQLRYEDLCREPDTAQQAVADFLGLPIPSSACLPTVDRARTTETFDGDPRADKVWGLCAETARRLGYGRTG